MNALLFLIVLLDTTPQQKSPEQIVTNFYQWYVDGGLKEICVPFVETGNGMTTLNFEKYDERHFNVRFPEGLIERSKVIYQ